MRPISLIVLLLTLPFLFFACASPSGEVSGPPSGGSETLSAGDETTAPPPAAGKFAVVLSDGTAIALGEESSIALSSLGEAVSVVEAKSCVRDGTDRIWTYNGFTVTTMPASDGKDRVASCAFSDDTRLLENRLAVGCGADEVTAVYGEDFTEQFGVRVYPLPGGARLTVALEKDSGTVSSLTFSVDVP